MSITAEDVKKIANLARLEFSPIEITHYTESFSPILDFIEKINQAGDLDAIQPAAHAFDITQRLRDDEPNEPNQRTLFQAIAPATEAGLYLVPKVIDE